MPRRPDSARPPIRQVLRERGISLEQVGAVLGVSLGQASHYVNGVYPVARDRAELLARFLGLDFDEAWRPEDVVGGCLAHRGWSQR